MLNAIRLKEWLICGGCGCKLAGVNQQSQCKEIFIKCHQCKEINVCEVEDGKSN